MQAGSPHHNGQVTSAALYLVSHALKVPQLEAGDHLDQKTFHQRYCAMPRHVRAELINGGVYMPSPISTPHSRGQKNFNWWLQVYEDATPGVEFFINATVILSRKDEPQPDLFLIIKPGNSGQTREIDRYIHGAPELVVEIAVSTASIDLYEKKLSYAKVGVREYVAFAERDGRIFWFVNRNGTFVELEANDGILRSETFPGLWLDFKAMVALDRQKVIAVLKRGLASKAHRAFVKQLARK